MIKGKAMRKSNEEWNWLDSNKQLFLQSVLLKKQGFEHGFFTKASQNKSPKELVSSFNENFSVHSVKQIHHSNLIKASKTLKVQLPEADGLISDQKGQSLWVYSADCIPALFGDPESGIVAATHAGWRGLVKGILYKTIDKLESFGARRNKLAIALGPAISRANYQVEASIIEEIYGSIYRRVNLNDLNHDQKIDHLINLGIIKSDKSPNKVLLDIRIAAAHQLYESGINSKQISVCPYCTFSSKSLFNSWRRDQVKAIQWSSIASSF